MRRWPMEFWGIAAYCVARAGMHLASLHWQWSYPVDLRFEENDRILIFFYAFAMLVLPIPLFSYHTAGRWMGTILLGVDATDMTRRMAEGVEIGGSVEPVAALAFAGSLWLNLYLQRLSSVALFKGNRSRADAALTFAAGFDFFNLIDLFVALGAGWCARVSGAPVWLSISVGLSAYMVYGIFIEDPLRQQWESFFARIEPDFPESDARMWRLACMALARNELIPARGHFEKLSVEGRIHDAGRLFSQALDWHELLSHPPLNGREALRRTVFDYDYIPSEEDQSRVTKHVRRSTHEDFAMLAAERAEFVELLTQAASNGASFFRARAGRMLVRVTGEASAFKAPGSGSAWWRKARGHWTGDAGPIALVVRLMFRNCHEAAVEVAKQIAGRAEEPLLVDLAQQMRFFYSIRQSVQGFGSFMQHPLQVLLVPQWTDAAGWLHADSPILGSLGVSRRLVARRLAMRPKMLDYAASLWKRYPADLNDDLPWLLPLLSGRNFGVVRARAKFETWWPNARETFVRHARAMNAGLSAFKSEDFTNAERQFDAVLSERPNDLSARYNLALCRAKRNDWEGAERLLRELAAMEPKEAYWWMALGDLLRASDKSLAARAAYRRAQHLGAAEGRIALNLGLTYAHESRDSEAMQLFERALGANPTVSKLEALANQLETEGCWKLAGHYREEALRRELDGPGSSGDEERGDETAV